MSDDKVKILMWSSDANWYHDTIIDVFSKEYDCCEPSVIIETVVKYVFAYAYNAYEDEDTVDDIVIELPKQQRPDIIIKDNTNHTTLTIYIELMDRLDGCEIRAVYNDRVGHKALFVTDELVHCSSLWDRLSSGSYAEDLKKLLSK